MKITKANIALLEKVRDGKVTYVQVTGANGQRYIDTVAEREYKLSEVSPISRAADAGLIDGSTLTDRLGGATERPLTLTPEGEEYLRQARQAQ